MKECMDGSEHLPLLSASYYSSRTAYHTATAWSGNAALNSLPECLLSTWVCSLQPSMTTSTTFTTHTRAALTYFGKSVCRVYIVSIEQPGEDQRFARSPSSTCSDGNDTPGLFSAEKSVPCLLSPRYDPEPAEILLPNKQITNIS